MEKKLIAVFLLSALPLFSQTNTGELRLVVTDPSGAGVKAAIRVISESNQYEATLSTDRGGHLNVQNLPYGIYQLSIARPGFAQTSETVGIHSTIPAAYTIQLKLSSVTQSVTVSANGTLVNPDQAGSVSQIGSNTIEHRLSSLPGRSLQDLVNSQPGWLYEGNAVLHPRGSEYQTQYVIDGIPLTDNRSPSFRPEIEANYFQRSVNNIADDDQIDNTTISFPIAFRKSLIYGAEAKLELPLWKRFSGYANYSYQVGRVWLPVTGGLFLGDAATTAATDLSGTFPDTQDQRNTLRGRLRYQISHRLWLVGGIQYGSGLPFEFACSSGENLDTCVQGIVAQYGQQIVNRIDFNRGRIRPTFLLDASAGTELYKSDRADVQLQIDGEDLNDVLDVIDFGGLFSGNAIGPSRSVFLRLTTTF